MEVKEKAILIVKKLVHEGYIAYFAGGCVRDDLMGHPSFDIDIATNAPPPVILDLFSHTIPVGLAFGVIIVVIEGHPFEVSTFRRDISYINGRQPESIELATAEEDATRRDFTINGLFYDPLENCVYDYVGGREDILKGIIRAIGEPSERFFEDRLRMIRAIRFSARFGFHIDQETEEGISENADTLLPAVAMERIWQELSKMSAEKRFCQAIIDMHRLGLLQVIFPELKEVHLNTIKQRTQFFKNFPKETPTLFYLMELFPDINEEDLIYLCSYLKVSNKERELSLFYHKYKKSILNPEKMNKSDLVHFHAHPASPLILKVQAAHMPKIEAETFLQEHENKRTYFSNQIERIKQKTPLITGAILAAHGISEGKKMGILLKEAEMLSITHHLTSEEAVMELLKKSLNWG